jgi:hypothetical protein
VCGRPYAFGFDTPCSRGSVLLRGRFFHDALIMFKDPERKLAYERERKARQRRARGVMPVNAPEASRTSNPGASMGSAGCNGIAAGAGKSRSAPDGGIASGRMGELYFFSATPVTAKI